MDIFTILNKLPPYLDLRFSDAPNNVVHNTNPIIKMIGGQIWLYYGAGGFELVIATRLDTMEELMYAIEQFCQSVGEKTELTVECTVTLT